MFDVIFRMLADGDAAVPAGGMQQIPDQLATPTARWDGATRRRRRVDDAELCHDRRR